MDDMPRIYLAMVAVAVLMVVGGGITKATVEEAPMEAA